MSTYDLPITVRLTQNQRWVLLSYLKSRDLAELCWHHFVDYRQDWLRNTTEEEWEPVCEQLEVMLKSDVHILMSPHQFEAFDLLCCRTADADETSVQMTHALDKVRESLFDKVRLEL